MSRLRRDAEDLTRKNRSLNEKIVEYQKTNERQRKDMEGIKEEKEKLVKEVEMHKIMLKSALAERERESEDSEDERERRRQRRRKEMGDENQQDESQNKSEVVAPKQDRVEGGGLDLGMELGN